MLSAIKLILTGFGCGRAWGSGGPLGDGHHGGVGAAVNAGHWVEVTHWFLATGISGVLDEVAVRFGQVRVDSASA